METLDPWADDVYVATLEPHPRGPIGRWLLPVLDLYCATIGGTLELNRRADVVVRRAHDGVEELRVGTRDAGASAYLLDSVRDDLALSTPEDFRRQWGID